MCRIAGIADKSLPMSVIEDKVLLMCYLQKHGGPDGEGVYQCPQSKLVLGHRRLSLFDLSDCGRQPMIFQDRYVISFNGEIYNFHELKNELTQSGVYFHSQTDTEVILAAFAKWNTQSFNKLSGMFAFALYDILEKNLFLVRDASGIKPLYYSSGSGSIVFASEMRAFSIIENKTENPNWPVFQLAYGFLPEPVTTLKEVKPLPKGFFLKINLDTGEESLQSFTHYSYSHTLTDGQTARNEIEKKLTDAVGRHLLADAPIGVFLSGGIDSGIITMLASLYHKGNLQTLSLYFNEIPYSEKRYQDSIIHKLKCHSHQHLLTESEFQESFPGILHAMDMPSCDGVNTWFISKYAREQGLKAVLSGIGSDELFGGYPSFERIKIARLLQLSPNALLQLARKSKTKGLKRLPYLSLEGIKGLYLYLRGQYTPNQIARQLDASEKEIWNILKEQPAISPLSGLSPKNEAGWLELNMYMQNQLLRDADVMSMAHGIEIRVPFLDKEVMRLVLSIDSKTKYSGSVPKQILINSFKDMLPEEVWNRQKMGFSFPFTEWLGNSTFVKDTMETSSAATKKNYQKFKQGKLHWSHLMSLIILQTRGRQSALL